MESLWVASKVVMLADVQAALTVGEMVSRWVPASAAVTDIATAVTRAYQKAERKDEQSAVGSAVDWVAVSDWSRAAWKAVDWAVRSAVSTVLVMEQLTVEWTVAVTATKSAGMSDNAMAAETAQGSAAETDDQTDMSPAAWTAGCLVSQWAVWLDFQKAESTARAMEFPMADSWA